MRKHITVISFTLFCSIVSAKESSSSEPLYFIRGYNVDQSVTHGIESSVIQDAIYYKKILGVDEFNVTDTQQVKLLSYVNTDDLACVQYVKFANEKNAFDGKQLTKQYIGTSYLIDEYCGPQIENNGVIYPLGLAALVDVKDNTNAQWQYPVFD